uniref:Uncharacterized protein n=1 Tax=Anguilla anguilla TaxID=7936 RepID=A0A0E9VWT6_ANGAN
MRTHNLHVCQLPAPGAVTSNSARSG